MKLTRSWIDEFVDIPVTDPAALADAFESLGHEVEEWKVLSPEFTGVVVGRVLEVSAHPDADKVRVTRVDVGTEILDIICGAWNFEAGAIVPVAVPGAVLGGDFTITQRDIRGITSNGMICSEVELGLGDDADGIMVLNEDYPGSADAIGADFAQIVGLPDVYYEISVTPNRPDCLSVYGLCRDLAALYEVTLRPHGIEVTEAGDPNDIEVEIVAADLCPRFAGRRVRGITVGVSPHWLRWRLTQAGVRPISNVVDASNYAMIEFGHPTHAFDVERLGNSIVVRRADEGEAITTLDDQVRSLLTDDVVVAADKESVAIGGIMGGATTEVHAGTTDVFIEAAYWDPATILVTSKRLSLRSEASARFERGADPSFCHLGADRVAQLLSDIAGGIPAPHPVDVNPGGIIPWTITYPLSETRRILGIDLDSAATTDLLERLTFEVSGEDPLLVTVPTRRPDVERPVDLVEEIGRLHGFEGIPDSVPSGPGGGLPFEEQRMRIIRHTMVGAGFYESLNFSFIGEIDLDALELPDGHPGRSGINVVNPLNDTEGVMRTTLIPGLLKSAASSLSRRVPESLLFEIGKVFLPGDGTLPDQPDRLAFLLAGKPDPTWEGAAEAFDVFDASGVWELLCDVLSVRNASVRRGPIPSFHPWRSAELLIGGVVVGALGEIHPSVAETFGLHGRVVGCELDLAEFLTDRGAWEYVPPSIFPPVIFDMAFIFDETTPASEATSVVSAAAGELLEHLSVFDVFSGESIGAGKKSIAMNIRLRAHDRTLTDEDAAGVRRAIASAVAERVNGTLRGEL
jgi:phenylalanyl-tRNA synthetase beta chain